MTAKSAISLASDGETGLIRELEFRSRVLHRQLAAVEEAERPRIVCDALDVGAEVLARADHHGDLDKLAKAVEDLDKEAKHIVTSTTENVERAIQKAVIEMTDKIRGDDGPLTPILRRFDPAIDGNVIDIFRDLVTSTASKATKAAVKELAESTEEHVERLTKSLAVLEKVAEVEAARLAEAKRGTAKGFDHERDTESLLGELVGVAGDSLDDVSTIPGQAGTKKGDKTICPKGGCMIVTEEKCTTRISESKIRTILNEAMANRGAKLAMLIVDDETKVPGNQPFHFIDEDKVVVVAEHLPLRLIYTLFRAKALQLGRANAAADDVDMALVLTTVRTLVEDIMRATERFRLLRTEHTKATRAISQAGKYVTETEEAVVKGASEVMTRIDSVIRESTVAAA